MPIHLDAHHGGEFGVLREFYPRTGDGAVQGSG
jgi:hypothetical protein